MKAALFAAGFVLAGVIGAVAGQVLFPAEVPEPASPTGLARLEARLDEVETQLMRVTEQLQIQRDAKALPAPTARPPAEAEATDGAADLTGSIPEAMIEEKVRETVEKIAMDAREERARKAEAAQVRKETAWLGSLKQELDLTDYQVEELSKLLVQRRRFIGALKAKYAAKGDAITADEKAAYQQAGRDFGQQLDAELRKLLSTTQYEGLKEYNKRRK